jgi:two-component system sensor histidine kinase/response regulator
MDSPRKNILVIDDKIDNFDIIETLLSNDQYEIYYASSGVKGLTLVESLSPDIILLDVMMPEMDGLQVCQRLKNNPQYQHIPVIMVTALNSKEDLARCLKEGADDFISKPIDGIELRARVRSLLRIKEQYDKLKNLVTLREETLRMREDMSNMIMHDLRNPLSTVVFAASVVERYIDKASDSFDKKELILRKTRQILGSGKRLEKMIDSLLLMAKLESGKILFRPVETDLHELGTDISNDFELIASANQIELVSKLPEPGRTILVDAPILCRVIDNLISNALKFSPAGSQVVLTLEYILNEDNQDSNLQVRVSVADMGPGVSAEKQAVIFEKFEIGELAQNVSQIGLGLAFCKMVVEAQGGSLMIQPNSPQGAIFIVEI